MKKTRMTKIMSRNLLRACSKGIEIINGHGGCHLLHALG